MAGNGDPEWEAMIEQQTQRLDTTSIGGTRREAAQTQSSEAKPEVDGRGLSAARHAGPSATTAAVGARGELDESSDLSGSEEETTWISWFCNLRGNEYFVEVDEAYIQDDFNLTGLSSMVPYYDYALDLILDLEFPTDVLTEEQQELVENAAEMLYGLIHARYVLTSRGMDQMLTKFQRAEFGRCPRVYCRGQPTLPVGLSDLPRHDQVKLYCPSCREAYVPKSSRQGSLDGAYFGTTFAHLLLMCNPEAIPGPGTEKYEPRVYGFRVSKKSVYYTREDGRSAAAPPSAAAGTVAASVGGPAGSNAAAGPGSTRARRVEHRGSATSTTTAATPRTHRPYSGSGARTGTAEGAAATRSAARPEAPKSGVDPPPAPTAAGAPTMSGGVLS